MIKHLAAKRTHVVLLLFLAHRERVEDRRFELVNVVWVHEGRGAKLIGGARELRKHENAALINARGDVFLRHEVHAVAKARHEHHVRAHVQRGHVGAGERAVHVRDGRAADRRKITVEAADGQLDFIAKLLVGVDPFA